jgi:hypothetical protein
MVNTIRNDGRELQIDGIRALDTSELDAVSGGEDLATRIFNAGLELWYTIAADNANPHVQTCVVPLPHHQ